MSRASIAGFEGQRGQAAYAASKAGAIGLTLPAARDLADKAVRCVAIAPGLFDTPLFADIPQKRIEALHRSLLCHDRRGDPGEFAGFVAFVVENPYLTGTCLRVDGGARSAFPIAANLVYSLQQAGGTRSILNGSMERPWKQEIQNITPDEVLTTVSYEPNGYEDETLHAVNAARTNGARILWMIVNPASSIAKSADTILPVREAEFCGFRSLSVPMCLAHALAVEFAFQRSRHA